MTQLLVKTERPRPGLLFLRLTLAAVCLALASVRAADAPAAAGGNPVERMERVDLGAAPAAPGAPAPNEPYRLGIGDVLEVAIYGEEGSSSTAPVDPSGKITYRIIGAIPAAGRTIDDVRGDLQRRVEKELRHACVTVTPVRFGSQTFTVIGQVRQPGTYSLDGRMGVFDAVARAGGLQVGSFRNSTADLFDLQHATLLRGGKTMPVDFDALIQGGDNTQNLPLESGDIITIPSALQRSVYVIGEVNYSRTIGMLTSISLIQALSEARGFKSTASGKLVIVRGSVTKPQVFVVDGLALQRGEIRDIMLAPGDIVYAPRPSMELLSDIVKAALNSFATAAAAEAGKDTFDKVYKNSSGQSVVTP